MLDTLIIGAGVAGLTLCRHLVASGRDVLVLEARHRAGGRVDTVAGAAPLDLGPGWFWPEVQPRMAALVQELGLPSFEQHDSGAVLQLSQADGNPEVLSNGPVHNGARRLEGGMVKLVDALVRAIGDRLRTGCVVEAIRLRGDHVEVGARSGAETVTIVARHVVLALPPRLIAESITFDPPLDRTVVQTLRETPTWMAAQAKACIRLPRAFWRERGQSGNAFVTHGQAVLAEVFDACAPGGAAALGGFVALQPDMRRACASAMPLMVRSQFAQIFGPEMDQGELHLRDWAGEPYTCSTLDAAEPGGHPDDNVALLAAALWNGRLHLAGSETASRGAGYLEGALDSAARVAARLRHPAVATPLSASNQAAVQAFAEWVATKRAAAPDLYRQSVVRALSASRSEGMTQAVLAAVTDHVYQSALDHAASLQFDVAELSVQQGRCVLTPHLLQPFSGFSETLIETAVQHNRTSCALSNFPDEHQPSDDYLGLIRRDMLIAWRAFAQSINDLLIERGLATSQPSL
ncbi:flavin monoamine oxidase family protein [Methyloversatilis thermotolerans]|uniref:flavin monoamine oxidase family protein n=1 Tax=Methyloversatilis thermotolerans TaxID=1346290 RepID=UPI000372E701|nr:FAD-dependent oxidoreductase [Methyloversatilis thermotolerans]